MHIKNLTILYLEDEDIIRENITKTLEYIFKKVFSINSVDKALHVYKNHAVDLILSDISMPDKNGLDFVKEVRESNKTIPIILLTAHTDTHYLLDATKLKLVDYLTKPINFEELMQALQKASEECIPNSDKLVLFKDSITYNQNTKQLMKDNIRVPITQKELQLLDFLYDNKHRTVPKEEIKNYIWTDYYSATESAFKSLLNKLRAKIGKDSIKNMSGVGYQLKILTAQ